MSGGVRRVGLRNENRCCIQGTDKGPQETIGTSRSPRGQKNIETRSVNELLESLLPFRRECYRVSLSPTSTRALACTRLVRLHSGRISIVSTSDMERKTFVLYVSYPEIKYNRRRG